jgi:hypothetical protein
LAVNTFSPFVDDGAVLSLPGVGSFLGPVEFEAQRTAGTRGYKPNLDVIAEPAGADWLFVESKCLEYLRPHNTAFSDAFVEKARELLPSASETYEAFKADPHMFELLDAAQLLKHFLAAKIAADGQRRVTLLYVYWEPLEAATDHVFVGHRSEAARLADALVDDEVRLVAMSYVDLWSGWDAVRDPALCRHVDTLRSRYAVRLPAIAAGNDD